MGTETPGYKELFVEGYEPGTFTLYDRKVNPTFLADYERNFDLWLRNVIENELKALHVAGIISYPVSEYTIKNVFVQTRKILEYKLKSNSNKRVSELIYNQEYCDIIHRMVLWLLTGQPDKEVHLFQEFNKLGFNIAQGILRDIPNLELIDLMKWSIASGSIGLDMKGEDAAASRLSSSGIKLAENSDQELITRIKISECKLKDIASRKFAIDFWPEFEDEVVNTKKSKKIVWFTDDYIETMFDLKFIEKMLMQNDNLSVYIVPRAGRFVNDAAFEDIVAFLRDPLFGHLQNLKEKGRIQLSNDGPKASCVNGKKLSAEVLKLLKVSDFSLFKGARTYEMMQGFKKTAYFSFVVCREFSEVVTGLDARQLPLVLIRQSAGEYSFQNFKSRSNRTFMFPDGRTIGLASKTALDYASEKHRAG